MTVSEFARRVGVSSKEIYLRIENADDVIQNFIKTNTRNNVKQIDEDAIKLYKKS